MKIQKRNLKIDDALLVTSEESEGSDVELTHPQKVDKLCYFIQYTLKLLSSLKNVDSIRFISGQKGKKKCDSNFKKSVPANNVKAQTKQNSADEYLVSESENKDVNFGSKDDCAFLRNLLKEKNKGIAKTENKICELQAEILECNRRNSSLQYKYSNCFYL